jgi:hypothetical protein
MNEHSLTNVDEIKNLIYTLRGVQVMLDRDLALFYGVKPIRLREQVKRNTRRFPSDFMFQLTDEEIESMVSQNAIPSKQHLGGSRPIVFTEQGVAAISAVLTSERAIEVNTRSVSKHMALDVKKFNEQYPAIDIREFHNAHDRFIVIDGSTVFHFGASLKDLGKKWFAFSKMDIGAAEMLGRLDAIL